MTTGALMFVPGSVNARNNCTFDNDTVDTFVMQNVVFPKGTTDSCVLKNAPCNQVCIQGEVKNAKFVIDISKNILYHYDESGIPVIAYSVASGKKSSPTDTGVRIVTHVETYPYRTAGKNTKRRRNPRDYGPNIICVEKLDPVSGKRSITGEFIHGNNNPASIGKYASLGCVRMDNDVIKDLSKQVKRGDIILIVK